MNELYPNFYKLWSNIWDGDLLTNNQVKFVKYCLDNELDEKTIEEFYENNTGVFKHLLPSIIDFYPLYKVSQVIDIALDIKHKDYVYQFSAEIKKDLYLIIVKDKSNYEILLSNQRDGLNAIYLYDTNDPLQIYNLIVNIKKK